MTRSEALAYLDDGGSHAAYSAEEALPVARAFGLAKVRMVTERANTHPKGYLDPTLPVGTKVVVVGGWDLACQIADHLKLTYPRTLGRGFQFRAVMKVLREAPCSSS